MHINQEEEKKNDTGKSAEAPFSCAEVQLNYLAMKILFVAQPTCS